MSSQVRHYCDCWQLILAGSEVNTHASLLVPVHYRGKAAILKIRKPASDEGNAAAALRFWQGNGAVHVYESDAQAMLLEQADASPSLTAMALSGRDDEAAAIIAQTIATLHATKREPPAAVTLRERFRALFAMAAGHPNSAYTKASAIADDLLSGGTPAMFLHGDIHHDNIMHSSRGWLAIDPKGIIGEATYDAANAICNPYPHAALVHDANRMHRHIGIYSDILNLDPQRLRAFTYAHACLAASWCREDGEEEGYWLRCAEIIA